MVYLHFLSKLNFNVLAAETATDRLYWTNISQSNCSKLYCSVPHIQHRLASGIPIKYSLQTHYSGAMCFPGDEKILPALICFWYLLKPEHSRLPKKNVTKKWFPKCSHYCFFNNGPMNWYRWDWMGRRRLLVLHQCYSLHNRALHL